MKWIKLIETEAPRFYRGMVFRLPGKYPYEVWVDFMIYIPPITQETGLGLMVISGYKRGNTLVILPHESTVEGHKCIEKNWLIKNWENWVYPDCDVSEVYISEGYTANPPSDSCL